MKCAKIIACLTSLAMLGCISANASTQINSINLSDGASLDVTAAKAASCSAYIAVYDEDGRLKSLNNLSTTLSKGANSISVSDSIDVDDNDTVAAFLWDENMSPLANSSSYGDTANDIFLLGDSIISYASADDVSVDGSEVTINSAGKYNIYGTLNDGKINVALSAKKDEAILNLNGVSITSSTDAAIDATEGKLTLYCSGDNYLVDGSDTTVDRDNACLFSKRDLTIQTLSGSDTASLNVTGNYSNGIRSKADLSIGNCDVTVNAVNNGIKGDDSVKFTKKATNITVTSGGDGIKSDYTPEIVDTTTGEIDGGTVTINGGIINVTTGTDTDGGVSDAIQGDLLVEIVGGSITTNSTGDGIVAVAYEGDTDAPACEGGNGCVNISGGTINVTTNGGYKGTATDESTKGIKAVEDITISGGTITVNSYDDSIHAGGTITLSGGDITVQTSDDGVHSDAYLYIKDNANIKVNSCYEGLEAAEIYISGRTSYVSSSDDGVNASGDQPADSTVTLSENTLRTDDKISSNLGWGMPSGGGTRPGGGTQPGGGGANPGGEDSATYGYLQIDGGYLFVTTSSGDGLDSNGKMVINSGTVVVDGATLGSEDGLDFDTSVTINGGFVLTLASGGMDSNLGSASTQKILTYGFSSGYGASTSTLSTGSYAITDASGNIICAFTRTKGSIGRLLFSSPTVSSGTYYIRKLTTLTATNALLGTVGDDYTFTAMSTCALSGTTKYTMVNN